MIRKNRSGLKKIGLLALALVLALGSLGVAYAAWTDEVYIQGTVNTGTVDINCIQGTSMFVYKVPGAPDTGYGEETVVVTKSGPEEPSPPPTNGILVASATADFVNSSSDTDTAEMHFSGLFPEIDFQAKLKMKYYGSIPVKIEAAIINPKTGDDSVITDLWNLGQYGDGDKGWGPHEYGIWIDGYLTPYPETTPQFKSDVLGVQLHQFDTVQLTMHVRIPQEEAYQNISGVEFSGVVTVVQWNEYE